MGHINCHFHKSQYLFHFQFSVAFEFLSECLGPIHSGHLHPFQAMCREGRTHFVDAKRHIPKIQQTAQASRFLLSDHSIFRIMRFKNFMTGTVTAIHFALFSSLPEYHDDFL